MKNLPKIARVVIITPFLFVVAVGVGLIVVSLALEDCFRNWGRK